MRYRAADGGVHVPPAEPGLRDARLADLAAVADHLRQGGLAILPTETGYMLAASATSSPPCCAFAVKARPQTQVMHVACASISMIATVGVLTSTASHLLGAFTPGPLSLVVGRHRCCRTSW